MNRNGGLLDDQSCQRNAAKGRIHSKIIVCYHPVEGVLCIGSNVQLLVSLVK